MSLQFDPLLARPSETLCLCPRMGETDDAPSTLRLALGFGLGVLAQALALSQLPQAALLIAPRAEEIGWPLALMLIGAALASFPAALLVDGFGRRGAFALGASLGVGGGLLAAFGMTRGHFPALCLGALWLGLAQGFGLFYRHIAASAQGGVSVLAGGALAALMAPLVVFCAELAGGGAATLLCASLLQIFALALAVRAPHGFADAPSSPSSFETVSTRPPQDEGEEYATAHDRDSVKVRFALLTLAGAAAWAIMAAAMLRGPLSLALCGAAQSFVGAAMAWHLLAMYGPAALAARWPTFFPALKTLCVGLIALAGAFALLRFSASPTLLAGGMAAIGAGWSLANIGALRLLHEKGPVPPAALALHDLCLLGAAAAGALAL
ncbi:hypothetical protein EDE12_10152 [Methylosinus sp. sav-2]|jgi:MFS family permease|uniref:hypothetical protein n=1 Tax=Methylosinus sp. sav-2 TaxID=2485168 RepID=UPI00047960CE|nr:hypothetical protein [Methylosinus sp. sav-2]TDX66521.1 hypothetical protein EDE12_10152 [Methylosinus sp. sav-2]